MKKNVVIEMVSNALGDTLAWMPYVEEYRLQNNCTVFCITSWNHLFEKVYPQIKFITAEKDIREKFNISPREIDLVIPLGYYIYPHIPRPKIHEDLEIHQGYNLQEYACLLLRLKYKEIKPKIYFDPEFFPPPTDKPYVTICTSSTAQCKFWNYPKGWEIIIEFLKSKGYEVFCVDRSILNGTISNLNIMPSNCSNKEPFKSLEEMINVIANSDFFIGLGSGMSWLAWGLNKSVIMISGFSDPKMEFYTPYRIINKSVCNSCFSKKEYLFDQSDWIWCPEHKHTPRMFECSKLITPDMVKEKINLLLNDILINKSDKYIKTINYYLSYINSLNIKNFKMMEINPGSGTYTKIFSKHFKNITGVFVKEIPKETELNLKNISNISLSKKSDLKDFSNVNFVYINIDNQTDLGFINEEISFWKNVSDGGLGGHGWSQNVIKNAILNHFSPEKIIVFGNDSWFVKI